MNIYQNLAYLSQEKIFQQAQQNPEYRKQFRGRPKRFVLPLTNQNRSNDNLVTLKYTSCKVKPTTANKLWIVPETILDVGCELPQIHRFGHAGKFYQYFYAINSDIDYEYCGAVHTIHLYAKLITQYIFHIYRSVKLTYFQRPVKYGTKKVVMRLNPFFYEIL